MSNRKNVCKHLSEFELLPPAKYQCDKCVEKGDKWVHLRACQICGEVNCCDSSVNKHASKHFDETGHSIIISAEPGERWSWCYVDKMYSRY